MNKKDPNCPICQKDYYNLDAINKICAKHSGWFDCIVTICHDCNRPAISPYKNVCIPCMQSTPKRNLHLGGNTDKRAILSYYGLEKYEG